MSEIGEILSGKVNFSGKTVDEWTRDFTNDPTYANAKVTAYNDEDGNSLRGTMGSDFMDQMYESMMSGSLDLGSVDYEEDIYLGYKWYETYWAEASGKTTGAKTLTPTIMGETTYDSKTVDADDWYDYNVVYPYGYGLSYTSFSYTLTGLETDTNVDLTQEGATLGTTTNPIFNSDNKENGAKSITAKVEVKNEGSVAGKETVEIYVEAPYTAGGIEKPAWTLVGFGKTNEIAAGQTDTIDITFNIQDFASFDYSDANNNGSNVYELDPGSYTVHVMESSSHKNMDANNAAYESATFSISGTDAVVMDLDDYSGNEVEAWFSGDDSADGSNAWKDEFYSNAGGIAAGTMATPIDVANGDAEASTLLSRADFDGTRPTAPTSTINGKTVVGGLLTKEYGSNIDEIRSWWMSEMYQYADSNTSIDTGKVWEKTAEDIPDGWTQGTGVADETTGMYDITLNAMRGVDLYDKDTGEINSEWDDFMNRLTWDELCSILNNGKHLTVAVPTIGLLFGKVYAGENYALIQCLARDEWGWTGHCVTDISTNSFGASMDGLVRAGAELPDGNWQDTSDGLSGAWVTNDTYQSGMVYIGASVDAATGAVTGGVASPTQWYSVRMGAMRVLYNRCNGAGNKNGITQSSYEVSLTLGEAANASVTLALDTSRYNIGALRISRHDGQ